MRGLDKPQRVALITGGSGAIGSAVAERLARRGEIVWIGYCGGEERAERLAAKLRGERSAHVRTVRLDVADRTSVRAAVERILAADGRLDILVHSAGVTGDRLLLQQSADDFARVLDVNVSSAFHLLQAALPSMRAQRYGRIVHIVSYAGLHGRAGQSAYAASKAALVGLTKAAALEEIAHGITVNAYAPSVTMSAMTDELSERERERLLGTIPLGRMQTPEEAAVGIEWLTAEEAGTVSGQVVSADTRLSGW